MRRSKREDQSRARRASSDRFDCRTPTHRPRFRLFAPPLFRAGPPGSVSPLQHRCFNESFFCPPGAAQPARAARGSYTLGGRTAADGGRMSPLTRLRCDANYTYIDETGGAAGRGANILAPAAARPELPISLCVEHHFVRLEQDGLAASDAGGLAQGYAPDAGPPWSWPWHAEAYDDVYASLALDLAAMNLGGGEALAPAAGDGAFGDARGPGGSAGQWDEGETQGPDGAAAPDARRLPDTDAAAALRLIWRRVRAEAEAADAAARAGFGGAQGAAGSLVDAGAYGDDAALRLADARSSDGVVDRGGEMLLGSAVVQARAREREKAATLGPFS